jgi:ATP-dependent RNA helicase DHX29
MQYIHLKLKLYQASAGHNLKSAQGHLSIEDLHAHLQAVRSHYLFDERDAEAHYLSKCQKAEAAAH